MTAMAARTETVRPQALIRINDGDNWTERWPGNPTEAADRSILAGAVPLPAG